jgi:flagellar biosynthesis protein FlhG
VELIARDQADSLRGQSQPSGCPLLAGGAPQVIAVASGKGGVGKTSLVANLAVAFANDGRKVLAIDGDLGLANLDLALGVAREHTLMDILSGRAGIEDVLVEAPAGVQVLPACSGQYDLANLEDQPRYALFSAIDSLEGRFDTVLIDTAAGIGSNAIAFAAAAQQVVVVATAEPTSLADAYALVKVLSTRCGIERVHVVANMVAGPAEGEEVYRRLCLLADRFLDVALDYSGAILRDAALRRSVHAGIPVVLSEPRASASRCFRGLAHRLAGGQQPIRASGGIQLFWRQLIEPEAS